MHVSALGIHRKRAGSPLANETHKQANLLCHHCVPNTAPPMSLKVALLHGLNGCLCHQEHTIQSNKCCQHPAGLRRAALPAALYRHSGEDGRKGTMPLSFIEVIYVSVARMSREREEPLPELCIGASIYAARIHHISLPFPGCSCQQLMQLCHLYLALFEGIMSRPLLPACAALR